MEGVSISGTTVVLTMERPMAHNDGSVKVSYDPPSSDKLQDVAGNDAPAFTDQSVTNNSAIPRITIRALHSDASPLIAEPEFEITRSNTANSDLDVELTVTQTQNYFSRTSYDWTIEANDTTYTWDTFPGSNRGRPNFNTNINSLNTDGTVTLTVSESDDYLPAIGSGGGAATIDIKLPPTGPTVRVAQDRLNIATVQEGRVHSALLIFETGSGVATPRHNFRLNVFTEAGTAQ